MTNALAVKLRLQRGVTPDERAEFAAFCNWVICWIILPNLPFLPITLLGGPLRAYQIWACGIVGLLSRGFGYWPRLGIFVGLLLYLVLDFIALMFNMRIDMILSVIGLVLDIRPDVSPEYLIGAILSLVICGLAAWRLRKPANFQGMKWTLCAVAVMVPLTLADYGWSREHATSYGRNAPANAPFTSATKQTDLVDLADGKTNVMVVVVEAMGLPAEPTLRARLGAIWTRPELAQRFDISRGNTVFYNSTTKGEMRELCQRWGDYDEITAPQPKCLPAVFARRGYQTHAYHAFSPSFFDRSRWWPLIGFQRMTFGPELEAAGAGHCPNVFPGACDRDIPRLIGKDLAAAKQPQFIYWLTLNSHLPVVANSALRTENCRQLGAELDRDFPQVCRLFSIWDDTAGALANMASQPDFPPTDILIVGDHMPPFTRQKSRLLFDGAHVPWILLRYRPSPPRPAA